MSAVIFFIAAVGAIAGAIGVIWTPNPFYSVLALVGHLLSLAALFLLLRAEFVAAAQVLVYAGAVMVLYVFVVAYVGEDDEPISASAGPAMRGASILFALVLFVEFSIAILGSGLKAIDGHGAEFDPAFGTPGQIGELLLTRFLLPFEVASFLLLIAAVGAVTLARRRGGVPEEDAGRLSVREALAIPPGLGSMREAAGDALVTPGVEPVREIEPTSPSRGGW